MDLNDFFMTGDADFITKSAASLFEGALADPLSDLMGYILDHQYVRSPFIPDMIFKVVQGSGMGLRHSAGLSNAAFCAHAEVKGVGIATASFQRKFGIKCYLRYVDNLFFIVKLDWVKIRALVEELQCSNSCLRILPKLRRPARSASTF